MTDHTGTRHRPGIGRRRFLGGLGATGLTVAGAVFGQAGSAQASSCGCCNLANCPPNGSYQDCILTGYYSWLCVYNAGIPMQCQCCEAHGAAHMPTESSYACWPQ